LTAARWSGKVGLSETEGLQMADEHQKRGEAPGAQDRAADRKLGIAGRRAQRKKDRRKRWRKLGIPIPIGG
jgi:hypothetical protein